MVYGGETFEDSRADGAQDEQGREAGVAHHGAPQKAASLVAPLEAPRQDTHEPVRERDAGVLVPPPVHHQGHVEAWKQRWRGDTGDYSGDVGQTWREGLKGFFCHSGFTRFPREVQGLSGYPQQNKNILALLLHNLYIYTYIYIRP